MMMYPFFFFENRSVCETMWKNAKYDGWNFNSGNYLFTTDTK